MNLNFWPKMYYSGGGGGGGGQGGGGGGGGGGYGSGGSGGAGGGYGGGAGAGGAGGSGGGAAGEQRPEEPTPVGAFRFNTDTLQLEYYDGNQWVNIVTDSPHLHAGDDTSKIYHTTTNTSTGSGTRGLRAGGQITPDNARTDTIDYINIVTTGNAVDFGNLTQIKFTPAGAASNSRGVFMGGGTPTRVDDIDFVTIASTGNAADFGNITDARSAGGQSAHSTQTRAILAGGSPGNAPTVETVNIIDYVTIAQTGNAVDFGDMSAAKNGAGLAGSPTRAILAGGDLQSNGTVTNVIEFLTMSTLGNTADFGDLIAASNGHCVSNAIQCVIMANASASTLIQSLLVATLGNSTDFGDFTTATRNIIFVCNDPTRGIFGVLDDNTSTNVIEYISMSTGGNASDFGDLTQTCRNGGGLSNGHGGLG